MGRTCITHGPHCVANSIACQMAMVEDFAEDAEAASETGAETHAHPNIDPDHPAECPDCGQTVEPLAQVSGTVDAPDEVLVGEPGEPPA